MKRILFTLLTLFIVIPAAAKNGVTEITSPETITEAGTYRLTGNIDGTVVVDADKSDKVELILDNVTIVSADAPAIWVKQADKVTVTLADGSVNSLANGGQFSGDEDAALYSKDDLVIEGSGSLSVSSPAGEGIRGKDELKIKDGTISVTAGGHGISANDGVTVTGGVISVTSGKDALRAENKDNAEMGIISIENGVFYLTSDGDGISATGAVQIENGVFEIITGGGSAEAEMKQAHGARWGAGSEHADADDDENAVSTKAIKADGKLTINGGTFGIDSKDDAVHGNSDVEINGGSFTIYTGDDAVHADTTVTINDGVITVSLCYEGIEGRDVVINGGSIRLDCVDDGLNAADGSTSKDAAKLPGGPKGPGDSVTEEDIDESQPSITINGGTIYVHSTADALDANGNVFINGGETVLCGPDSGDTQSLDFDRVGIIEGGTFIGTGAMTWMSQSFSSASQGVIAQKTWGNAGVALRLTDASGNLILETTPEENYSMIILSAPALVPGESYLLNGVPVTAE